MDRDDRQLLHQLRDSFTQIQTDLQGMASTSASSTDLLEEVLLRFKGIDDTLRGDGSVNAIGLLEQVRQNTASMGVAIERLEKFEKEAVSQVEEITVRQSQRAVATWVEKAFWLAVAAGLAALASGVFGTP